MNDAASVRQFERTTLLAFAFLSLIAFVALSILAMRHYLDGADQVVRTLVHGSTPSLQGSTRSLLGSSMETASYWGGRPGQLIVIIMASVMLWPRRRRWSLALPAVMAGAGALQFAAKWAFDRPRPNLNPWGFPSAHVLSLVVLCGCLAYIACTSTVLRTRRWRALPFLVAAAIVFTVGYSRIYLDAHWLSDVLGGLTMGSAYLLLVFSIVGDGMLLERVAEGHVGEAVLLVAEPSVDPGDEGLTQG